MSYGFRIIVTGDYACFTMPELKTERVSYDVPTPSAMEGLLGCVYKKPAIRWVIDKIYVFNPIHFSTIKRNEIESKLLLSKVSKAINGTENQLSIYADEKRSQRSTTMLKDVKYGLEFHFEMTGLRSDQADENDEKHYNIMLRRLKKGACFRQPCLGCREFAVRKIELVECFDLSEICIENKGDRDLGWMLYGLKYKNGGLPINGDWENPVFSDEADAVYYRPHMVDGCIDVAKYCKVTA